MKYCTILLSLLLLASCRDSALKQELAQTKEKLATTQKALAKATSESDTETAYPLVHVVYFKLKPDADRAELIEAINTLKAIEVLHNLEIGTFEDLKDKRALSDYQLMMSMAFKNKEAYAIYQTHEIHLALKANTKDLMAGPPATYDYLKK